MIGRVNGGLGSISWQLRASNKQKNGTGVNKGNRKLTTFGLQWDLFLWHPFADSFKGDPRGNQPGLVQHLQASDFTSVCVKSKANTKAGIFQDTQCSSTLQAFISGMSVCFVGLHIVCFGPSEFHLAGR